MDAVAGADANKVMDDGMRTDRGAGTDFDVVAHNREGIDDDIIGEPGLG